MGTTAFSRATERTMPSTPARAADDTASPNEPALALSDGTTTKLARRPAAPPPRTQMRQDMASHSEHPEQLHGHDLAGPLLSDLVQRLGDGRSDALSGAGHDRHPCGGVGVVLVHGKSSWSCCRSRSGGVPASGRFAGNDELHDLGESRAPGADQVLARDQDVLAAHQAVAHRFGAVDDSTVVSAPGRHPRVAGVRARVRFGEGDAHDAEPALMSGTYFFAVLGDADGDGP